MLTTSKMVYNCHQQDFRIWAISGERRTTWTICRHSWRSCGPTWVRCTSNCTRTSAGSCTPNTAKEWCRSTVRYLRTCWATCGLRVGSTCTNQPLRSLPSRRSTWRWTSNVKDVCNLKINHEMLLRLTKKCRHRAKKYNQQNKTKTHCRWSGAYVPVGRPVFRLPGNEISARLLLDELADGKTVRSRRSLRYEAELIMRVNKWFDSIHGGCFHFFTRPNSRTAGKLFNAVTCLLIVFFIFYWLFMFSCQCVGLLQRSRL